MRVTEEMLARYERECEKRAAEKAVEEMLKEAEQGSHTAAQKPVGNAGSAAALGNAAVGNEKSAAVAVDDAEKAGNETVDGSAESDLDATGILEELTIPGIVINIGEINIGEAVLNIHNAEHYESSTWLRDGSCGDSSDPDGDESGDPDYIFSDDSAAVAAAADDDEPDGRENGDGNDGCGAETTSAILSTEHHSVEVDQADMKDAISHILKINRSTVDKVFLGMRLYLDALAEVMDEAGDETGGQSDSRSTDVHRHKGCKGCRIIHSTPESRAEAHRV